MALPMPLLRIHIILRAFATALLMAGALIPAASGAIGDVSVTDVPSWVQFVDWDHDKTKSTHGNSSSESSVYLLINVQHRPTTDEYYRKRVYRVTSESGVRNNGQVTIDFDPSYAELQIHKIIVHRDGKELDQLDMDKIKIFQPEEELSNDIYRGDKRCLLFLEDLRVGDTIQVEYTTCGTNPALSDTYSFRMPTQWSIPVEASSYRLVWDSTKPIRFQSRNSEIEPKVNQASGVNEYVWDVPPQAAAKNEDSTPYDFNPTPYIEVSSCAQWNDVARWATRLYQVEDLALNDEMRDLLAKWKSEIPSDAERAAQVLRFVQEEIRYVGIEIGQNSFRPRTPGQTLGKRFGDCKDKANLMCFLLRELNIEAFPALVSTYRRGDISNSLPTPLAFDHAIVRLTIHGKKVWVDPTSTFQRGPITSIHIPRYGKALVVNEESKDLDSVEPSPKSADIEHTRSVFEVTSYDQPAKMATQTIYKGAAADSMRRYLSGADLEELSVHYLNHYAQTYAGIRDPAAIEIDDNQVDNTICVKEAYTIDDLFASDDSDLRTAKFLPYGITSMLPDPSTRIRKMPLRVPFATQRIYENIVNLPNTPDLDDYSEDVQHSSFNFAFSQSVVGNQTTFKYSVETLKDRIEAAESAEFFRKSEKVDSMIGDYLSEPVPFNKSVNWFVVAVVAAYAIGLGTLLYWLCQSKLLRRNGEPTAEYQKIGGPLLLVGFGLCLTPVVAIRAIAVDANLYFSQSTWEDITYGLIALSELITNLTAALMFVALTVLFFAKRGAFPKLYVGSRTLLLALSMLNGFLIHLYLDDTMLVETLSQIVTQGIGCLFWCPYLLLSKRSKGTFVR